MNRKGTLCVRQRKDHARVKILYDSSNFRANKAFTNHKASIRRVKGLVKFAQLRSPMDLLQSLNCNVMSL